MRIERPEARQRRAGGVRVLPCGEVGAAGRAVTFASYRHDAYISEARRELLDIVEIVGRDDGGPVTMRKLDYPDEQVLTCSITFVDDDGLQRHATNCPVVFELVVRAYARWLASLGVPVIDVNRSRGW